MKKILLLSCFFFVASEMVSAQAVVDYAVLVRAQVQESPARITLMWPLDNTVGVTYTIYRKKQNTSYWTDTLAQLDNTNTQYIDNNVVTGKVYEYWVKKIKSTLSPRNASGYITAGIKIPDLDSRGKMILLVDQNYVTPLATEITQLENDLIGDGWQILRHDVARTATVASVKQLIANDYVNQSEVKGLFLLGRVPVPYSGGFVAANGQTYPPDGHPDHSGAWPADVFYGSFNELIWSDNSVNDTTSGRIQNRNTPGDGKYDQMYIYGDSCALQIGRVDFSNMPAFGLSDTLLMKRYLSKNHNFKVGKVQAERRGLVTDNFGGAEAFGSSGYRAFSAMFGDSVTTVGGSGAYFSTMRAKSYLWAYGAGGGSYTSASGIGTTTDFVNDSLLNVFSMLFGSYFGDWDSQNNFLRAPLAHKGWTLTCSWSGRPYWMYHPMALGSTTGFCAQLSQNNLDGNTFLNPKANMGYTQNSCPTFIHVALMGDPSLRMHPVLPVTNLTLTTINQQRHVVLTWNRSADNNITSYKIYRSNARNGSYTLLGSVPASDSTYTDGTALDGVNYYQVKAVKMETSFSGTYYNPSIGVMDTISARRYVSVQDVNGVGYFTMYPNPARNEFYIKAALDDASLSVKLFDVNGQQVRSAGFDHVQSTCTVKVDVSGLPNGVYYVQMQGAGRSATQKLVLMR